MLRNKFQEMRSVIRMIVICCAISYNLNKQYTRIVFLSIWFSRHLLRVSDRFIDIGTKQKEHHVHIVKV